jgi:hypothetical protein
VSCGCFWNPEGNNFNWRTAVDRKVIQKKGCDLRDLMYVKCNTEEM